jgi:hypothetical protein
MIGICSSFSSVANNEKITLVQKGKRYMYSFTDNPEDKLTLIPTKTAAPYAEKMKTVLKELVGVLLPKGYPSSVGPGYKSFAQFQMLSACLSSAGGILSMQSLLVAVGVGSGSALPLAATLNWVLKDGLGQFGGIIFASFINIQFDTSPRKWRFFSAISLEISNFIEILTPLAGPQLFLPLAAVANVGKNISFLASGASRAAIHNSFAVEENLADITARTGSQNILSSMIGTSLGIAVSSAFLLSPGNELFYSFFLLSLGSLYCNYRSLKSVTINSLNYNKLEYLIHSYFRIWNSPLPGHLFTPRELTPVESVITDKIKLSFLDRELFFNYPFVSFQHKIDESFRNQSELQVISQSKF